MIKRSLRQWQTFRSQLLLDLIKGQTTTTSYQHSLHLTKFIPLVFCDDMLAALLMLGSTWLRLQGVVLGSMNHCLITMFQNQFPRLVPLGVLQMEEHWCWRNFCREYWTEHKTSEFEWSDQCLCWCVISFEGEAIWKWIFEGRWGATRVN